ncbi:hypothetical protein FQA47_017292 [Oryzias melastigma]|uniref:Uncharacterized protein n=1 Tax=Oryzias melastigma TaxID=30732 RepID=A0A834F333_ORYME|nr:hypothetical protein FQA47_017292 [Oryzias melastigma]
MKTWQLLLGVTLGLLAAVHSTPLSTVSNILAQPEEDVFAEAMTEGFLINEPTSPSPTTESFKTNTTSQAPLLSDFVTEGSGEIMSSQWLEGSGEDPIGTSAVPTQDSSLTTESGENPETPHTTQWPHLEFTTEGSSTTSPYEWMDASGDDPIGTSAVPTQDSSLTTESGENPETPHTTQWPHLEFTTEGSSTTSPYEWMDGSGDDPIGTSAVPTQDSTPTESFETTNFMMEKSVVTPSSVFDSTTETTTESISSVLSEDSSSDLSNIQTTNSESTPFPVLQRRNFLNVGFERFSSNAPLHDSEPETANSHSSHGHEKVLPVVGHSRQDWLVIVGVAVGIMALMGLCVAVATRDKWNKKSSSSDKNTNLQNQKMEQEMQTFLTKSEPKENGQNGEYTVIPLADIPEKYLSN